MGRNAHEPMMEMFIFETSQLLEQLEQIIIRSEKEKSYSSQDINEIFRTMHTIKGSSAMMLFNGISSLAHSIEDLFYFMRESKPACVDFPGITDLVLKAADFIKTELAEIEEHEETSADSGALIEEIKQFLVSLKGMNGMPVQPAAKEKEPEEKPKYYIASNNANMVKNSSNKVYRAVIFFEDDSKMENIRAFGIVHNLKDLSSDMYHIPSNVFEDDSEAVIRQDGFLLVFKSDASMEIIREVLMQTVYLKSLELEEIDCDDEVHPGEKPKEIRLEDTESVDHPEITKESETAVEKQAKSINTGMISVSIAKLDKLMDLVGELVIAESMVTQNSDLKGLVLDNFNKAARQLKKLSGELQDMVMSIRMISLAATFQKMNRIVRDMSKKLGKNVRLDISGEETEVDKNIIDHISDPLMHLIRNAIDHGIENREERASKGKPEAGSILLEAKNAGGDVLIIVKDDGKGLDRDKILEKAKRNGLLKRPENELTNREIFSFVFLPGFSTKENVSEFSGRGVGMDVVMKNIEKIGGSVSVDSSPGEGTTITVKIPLTLAIIDGMNIQVGKAEYIIPTSAIRESFRPGEKDVFTDPQGNEMIMIRGKCFPILRLHERFKVKTDIVDMHKGIMIMVETESRAMCLFADALLGEQQVVVKALPKYIKKTEGLAGCTLLGNGSISLILDVAQLMCSQ